MSRDEAEAQIRAAIQDRIEGTRAKDAERAARHFAGDAVLFDVVGPLRHHGAGAAEQRAEQWFSTFNGPIGFEIASLQIEIGADVAFSHALNHVHGQTAGGPLDMWWRATTCYRCIDGTWKIVHEHNSVPFEPSSGKASVDLQP